VRHRDAGGVRGHVPLEGLDGHQRARGGGHCGGGGGGEGVRVGRVWRRRGKGWGWWRKVRVYIGAWLQGLGFGADDGLWAVGCGLRVVVGRFGPLRNHATRLFAAQRVR
jgi:hypothetical protein